MVNEANRIYNGGKVPTTGKHADLWLRWEAAAKKNIIATVAVKWVPSHEARGSRKITETDRIGNNGADALANAAAKKAGPTVGQGKLYVNLQKLCTYVQKTQETILAQIQIVEAQPGDAGDRRQQNLAGHA
eukprot:9873861-Heterocapsa_arctica.AAC.1